MKSKILQIILIGFIVFMLAGILFGVKDNSSSKVDEISDFETQEEYNPSGYTSEDLFNEDNVNAFGKLYGKIGEGVSNGVNKTINLFFQIVKKLVT